LGDKWRHYCNQKSDNNYKKFQKSFYKSINAKNYKLKSDKTYLYLIGGKYGQNFEVYLCYDYLSFPIPCFSANSTLL
jgi:hypothetical protein